MLPLFGQDGYVHPYGKRVGGKRPEAKQQHGCRTPHVWYEPYDLSVKGQTLAMAEGEEEVRMMDHSAWMLIVGAASGGKAQTDAIVWPIIAAVVACNIPGVVGIQLTIRSGSARSAMLLLIPFLIISATVAIAGLVLLLTAPTRLAIGLAIGGGVGFLESVVLILVAIAVARQRQGQKTGKPR